MDTDRFLYIKTKYIYVDITKNVETIFDTSNYDLDIPLPKGKNEKVIGLTKGELGRKITGLIDDGDKNKKPKT